MVIEESLLPADILKRKPKATTLSKKRRGKTATGSGEPIPVRFFADDTYNWMDAPDLSPLTLEMIGTFKKKGSKLFVAAYEFAANPPVMSDFAKWGSYGQDNVVEEEEPVKPVKRKAPEPRVPAKKSKPEPTKKAPVRVPKASKTKPRLVIADSSDDEFDLTDYEDDFGIDVPFGKELSDLLRKFEPVIVNAKIFFQKAYVNDINLDEKVSLAETVVAQTSKTLDTLLKNATVIPLSVVYKSSLFRVLLAILKRPELEALTRTDREWAKTYRKFQKLVAVWFDMEVQVDERWSMREEEKQQTETTPETEVKPEAEAVAEI
ncbi:hypothetical protein BABINDRAFT_162033 [Babjeviella inositovora NRRL Y-12698]|uniref:PWWP domain-containing protein n=1 Tax=Babjeviella inositovora NRRL Y-12698 TaxID=984486 RepID=A0A1E3QRU9_9ASCO|nr:uncharacterized protein BABINDRAFT_162033 [Babjeviella inositovora NRRL Y-12698]ODQ79667.1 hypothetical protein BABINDRAFT_162033 [Babjeviella inositovora NRRL Y-12698]